MLISSTILVRSSTSGLVALVLIALGPYKQSSIVWPLSHHEDTLLFGEFSGNTSFRFKLSMTQNRYVGIVGSISAVVLGMSDQFLFIKKKQYSLSK